MRILNWNTQADRHRVGSEKLRKIKERVAGYDADIICLTEAYPDAMPDIERTISSELSGWEGPEKRGARKVLLWSCNQWSDVDTVGSPSLPPGRFIKATTFVGYEQWTIIGMCIPYAHYHNHAKWGDQRKTYWQGAGEYLDALREEVMPSLVPEEYRRYSKEPFCTVLLGDFNMQIPPFNYPYRGSDINQKRSATFDRWLIPTAGISRHFIDHVAMSTELRVGSLHYISPYDSEDKPLSDHQGVVIDVLH